MKKFCAGRVQRIDAVLKELETGDLKLRVRALEVERAARRSSILQVWQAALHTLQPETVCAPCVSPVSSMLVTAGSTVPCSGGIHVVYLPVSALFQTTHNKGLWRSTCISGGGCSSGSSAAGGVVQGATINAIGAGTLVNVGSQLAMNGQAGLGGVLLAGSGVFGILMWRAFRRVRRIDKFEKGMRS